MTLVLSFDPGKNNGGRASGSGWCLQDETKVFDYGVSTDLIELLATHSFGKPSVVVYEGYGINPKNAAYNIGKDLTAIQNIGAIKLYARVHGAKLQMYRPDQKPAQWKATGANPTKVAKDQSHYIDAFNHGRYYLITHGLAPSALEKAMQDGTF